MSKILAINPGATSTKVAIFEGNEQIFLKNIKHSTEELSQFATIADQYEFRKNIITSTLEAEGIDLHDINIVMGRGGLVKPLKSGVYKVNDLMLEHLKMGYSGQHACNLGGLIADSIAKYIGLECAYIADPVMVDEMNEIARISGHPMFERQSIFHALNHKAIGRMYAKDCGKKYEELNLIITHMGGGVSVGAHEKGKVVDVNQALDGEGPFSPERSGSLPMNQFLKACFSGKYTQQDMQKMLVGKGGYVGYFGSNDAYAVEKAAIAGDPKAELLEEAFAYQVAKQIGENACVLKGKVDAIILTGGIAYGKPVVNRIKKYVEWIAPVAVYPGEDEMAAMALNANMILNKEIEIQEYK